MEYGKLLVVLAVVIKIESWKKKINKSSRSQKENTNEICYKYFQSVSAHRCTALHSHSSSSSGDGEITGFFFLTWKFKNKYYFYVIVE